MPAAAFTQFVDPHPAAGNEFGATVVPLDTGNVVVTSQFDDAGGTDAGAVYLFNGATGALISTITGSHANDQLGSGGITELTNGNFVINSPLWDDGISSNVGAATWASGTTGVNGVVSTANSLVGSQQDDRIGDSGIIPLTNGNYVVTSWLWSNGDQIEAGAVTWGDGTQGISGVVSSANSLVGKVANDEVGGRIYSTDPVTLQQTRPSGVTALPNGNYVVDSPYLDLGIPTTVGYRQDVGAVTWGNGTTGITGSINATNSLIGSQTDDWVGISGVVVLSNGNYLVTSSNWANGTAQCAGAVTWGDGTTGVSGLITTANSLVGTAANDLVGSDAAAAISSIGNAVTPLQNGNYVIRSRYWDNGATQDAGAVTFANGLTGIHGTISGSNSLIGTHTNDQVGSRPIILLTNGNFVVSSPIWNSDTNATVGAVTLMNALNGVVGAVSETNSLVGESTNDRIGGDGITPLVNGNYVVCSSNWSNGTFQAAGAVTLANGVTGTVGIVTATNSLVGSHDNDQIGYENRITALQNGNYVVDSFNWSNSAGAVTWGDGMSGIVGVVSDSNSLVGQANDWVGYFGVTQLANGNYVVSSPNWTGGANPYRVGAVTWGSGTSGVRGFVSSTNSLIGSTQEDNLTAGIQTGPNYFPTGLYALANGNYLIVSPKWDNGLIVDAGAVTWANGTTGITGVITAANSLVGTSTDDQIGSHGVTLLDDGNYVVDSPLWDNGNIVDAGAVTWGDAATGIFGPVSTTNSLVGTTANDQVGSNGIETLSNGNYSVNSPQWDNPSGNGPSVVTAAAITFQQQTASTIVDAGAVTFGVGTTGVNGQITTTNSAIGTGTASGPQSVILDNANHNFFAQFPSSNGTIIRVGSQVSGFANTAPTAVTLTNKVTSLPDDTSTATHVKVADVGITDDALGTNVLSVSGADAASFEIVNGALYLKAGVVLNALNKSTHAVTVNVNDPSLGTGPNASTQFTLTITRVKRPPVVANFAGPVFFTENGQPLPLDSAVTIADPDMSNFNGGALTVAITLNGEASDRLQVRNQGAASGQIGVTGSTITFSGTAIGMVTGGTGATPLVVTLNGNATPAATQALLRDVTYVNISDNSSGITRTVQVSLTDGQGRTSNAVTKPIAVAVVNDPPLLSAIESSTLSFVKFAPAIPISASVLVADPDSDLLHGATITITGNYQQNEDVLGFVNTPKITASWNGSLGVLTLTGTDSVSNYRTALRNVTYRNSSPSPNTALTRTVSFQVNDGSLASNAVTRPITISTTAASPTLSGLGGTVTFTTRAAAVAIAPNLSITQPNGLSIASTKISFTNWQSGDRVAFTNTYALQHTFVEDLVQHTATLTLSGIETMAHYQTELQSVVFSNVAGNPVATARVATVTITDVLGDTAAGTQQIHINQAPLLSAIETTPLTYQVNQPQAATTTSTILVADADSDNMTKATVQITSGYQNNAGGHDQLSFVNQLGITGSFDAATGTLTLTGTSYAGNYRTALRSVKFITTGSAVSLTTRTLTITVTDDTSAISNPVTRNISVQPNAAPTISGLSSTISYTHGQAALLIASSLILTDSDSTNLTLATISFTNWQSGDRLDFSNQFALNHTFVEDLTNHTATLTLTGSSSLANYQATIRTIAFHIVAGNPLLQPRTATIVVNDGYSNSNAAATTIKVL